MASKRKASAMNATATDEPVDPSDELMFLCLGGGNEVGRSCHIIQYKGKTVMLDAGQHPAYDGLAALPFYDDFDLSTVDVLLISHFHIDHAASLPYVLSKTNFRGRVFMTHPTKAIYKWLIQDSVRVGNTASNSATQLYTEQDHLNTFPQIEAIDYHTTHTISSIRITPYPAGHVLGAAMFLIEIAGLNIFFTGDYSREQDRHLVSAEVPKGLKIDVLITESTYGIASHVPRLEREQALMKSITGILNRGGRALLPVFALGRAQELLLILDEYWGKHPEFQRFPIYYASNLARKCMVIYQTYVGAMNDNIKRLFRERMAEAEASGDAAGKNGPWDFKYIRSLKNLDRFDDVGGCVMLASPGMLQNGVSRELFERWAPSEKNGVIITGYSVEGTMARQIMQEPDQIQAVMSRSIAGARRGPGADSEKVLIPRRCSVQEYSFAAHVDGVENREFIEEVAAPVVILVHGEQHNMMRLKSKLLSLNASKTTKVKVYSPRNCEELRIPFKADKTAKVVGKLASIPPPKDVDASAPLVTGVLVQNDFKLSLMAPEDLREYAGLNTTTITCKQRLTLSAAGVDLVRWALEGTFGAVEELPEMRRVKNGKLDGEDEKMAEDADEEVANLVAAYLVMGCVSVRYRTNGEVELEWEGNMLNDGIADSVMAVLFSVESSPAAVKRSSNGKHSHSHSHGESDDKLLYAAQPDSKNPHAHVSPADRLERLMWFLEAQFGADNVAPVEDPKLPPLPAAAISPKEEKKEEDDDEDSKEGLKEENANGEDVKSEAMDVDEDAAKQQLQERQHKEIARLHKIGIPVPGISIKVDKMTATVWLEDLEVECNNKVFADRVRAVVERAVEVTAPLWG
ncbi:pre-mRNA 3'-end-processing endonuclease polyadenylation factor c-term domain-containing protein [Trichoderma breve]|uniref:Pre-mRNA 3'-end-processing endonuclease polyadenylation factor c-term domain-containing protein n=1 Tax=Trichoderma breve TaxID=2034170 RepID=A0A9W9B6L9_9HYPO|nr:pre-mRNA 3'-end-processing endonuclease polyadenylation factor c-term domain-containing protein [Trichoderma breve]KAJ4857517.1 pre-mRNA 3'-end-processing endonuclease polyadenylation factor c-term domain-containing protein [Trichoderma breve]